MGCDGVWDTLSNQQVIDEICNTTVEDVSKAAAGVLDLCIKREADDNLTLLVVKLGEVPEEPRSVEVTAGNFLKTKDKEALEQYAAFCLRFGFSLTKEMRPKAPPAASLSSAAPVPGHRYAGLPLPAPTLASMSSGPRATAESVAGTMQMKVTSKRPAKFYISSARAMLAGTEGASTTLEVLGLGNAVPNAAAVAAALSRDGHSLTATETSSVEVVSQAAKRSVQVPQLRIVLKCVPA